MDVSMPLMGGKEATELIRAWEEDAGIPRTAIIALTAHASAWSPLWVDFFLNRADTYSTVIGDRERCLKAGMDDHITKPLRRTDLINSISKLVNSTKNAHAHAPAHKLS